MGIISVTSSKLLNIALFSQLSKNRVAVVQQKYFLMTTLWCWWHLKKVKYNKCSKNCSKIFVFKLQHTHELRHNYIWTSHLYAVCLEFLIIQNQGSTYSTFGVEMIQYFPSTFLAKFWLKPKANKNVHPMEKAPLVDTLEQCNFIK